MPATKSPAGTTRPARTAIRHRCARRVSEGVRENPREGTRQNDPVPSVQGVLITRVVSRRESALAIVYQKPRTLPTRKRTYRVGRLLGVGRLRKPMSESEVGDRSPDKRRP